MTVALIVPFLSDIPFLLSYKHSTSRRPDEP